MDGSGGAAVSLLDADAELIARLDAVRMRPVAATPDEDVSEIKAMYRVQWQPVSLPLPEASLPGWAVIGDAGCGVDAPVRHPDLAALCAALDAGAPLPEIVVLCPQLAAEAELAPAAHAASCALLGFLIERFAYRPLREKPRLTALITAIGISFALSYGFQLDIGFLPGAAPRAFPEIITPTVIDLPLIQERCRELSQAIVAAEKATSPLSSPETAAAALIGEAKTWLETV